MTVAPAYSQTPERKEFPKRGEIWWVRAIPNQPGDPHVPRPAIVVSTNPRNKNWDSVIVVPLSHGITLINERFHILVPKGEGGMPKESYARCELVSTIEKAFLDSTKGALGSPIADKYMFAVVHGIRQSVGDREF